MALFNGWPWANFQEQNLDWIIKELKKHADSIENLQSYIDDLAAQVNIKVQEILNKWLSDGTLETLLQNLVNDRMFMSSTLTGFDGTRANNGDLLQTSGYNTLGDGGYGIYVVNNSSGLLINGVYYFPLYGAKARSYGVICDGSQDNADQLQAALGYTDSVIFDPSDIVVLSKPVNLFSNRRIYGNNCLFITANNNTFSNGSAMLTGSGLNNVQLSNIRFNRQTGTQNFYAISIISSSKICIENCEFFNGKGYVIRCSEDKDSKFINLKANNIEGVDGNPGGLLYMQGGNNNVFRDIYTDDITDHTVYLDGSSGKTVREIEIDNISQKDSKANLTNGAVIAVYGDCQKVNISRVRCDNVHSGIQVSVRDAINPKYISIADCTLLNVIENGITIHGNQDATIEDCYNTVDNCFIQAKDGTGQDGVSIRHMNRCSVSNCMETKFARFAVEVSNVSKTIINNNVAVDCYSAVTLGGRLAASENIINCSVDMLCTYASRVSYPGSANNYINCPTALSCTNLPSVITGNYIRNPEYTAA